MDASYPSHPTSAADGGRSGPGDQSTLRAICVTFNPGPELRDFVTSLRAATAAAVDLVLVENGPDPSTAQQVVQEHGGRVLSSGANLGYGTAANLGAEGATQEWLVVANPDVVWEAGSLDALLEAGRRHPEAGALGPAVLNPDGSVYPSARELPSLVQGVGHAVLGRVWPSNPWTVAYQRSQEGTDGGAGAERRAGWLSGACLLLRREAFEQVGGFDEGYFMFFEDLDLGERLAGAGWTSIHVPSSRVTHVGGTSWRDRPAPMIRAHHASAARYLCRRYHRWYQWPVRVAVRAGLALRQAVELRRASA